MELVANFILNNESLDANFDVSEVQNFDALFEIYANGTVWGTIEGDITNQTDLQNILNGINGNIGEIETTVSNLQTTVSDNYSELNTKIQNEAATRTENDNLLQGNINTLSDNLTAEISNRESADSGLQTQITNLTGTVSSNYNTLNNKIDSVESDLQGDIDTLGNAVNTNTSNISTLNTTVSNLNTTVQSNYTILDTKINTTQTTLQGNIDTLSGTVTSNYNDLTQSITNNVSTLNTRITNEVSTLNGAITNEATARANADNNLQTQIDAIVSSSDVFDIVGTYAELQAYDISTVPVKDIIKVLVDSTHNNAATYYRCVENAGVKSWSYIGSEGAYYTKGETDSTFVPQTRTINNKALNQNINLTASDVGALPVGTQIGNGTILLTQGGVQKGTFTLNQTSNATIDFDAVSEDITVDSELSTTSENPVQNKIITTALNAKQDNLTAANAGTDIEIINRTQGGPLISFTNDTGYTTNVGTVTSVNNTLPDSSGNVTLNIPTPTVDQTYNASSTNAQSGVAINGANFVQNKTTVADALSVMGSATTYQRGINIGTYSSAGASGAVAIGWAATTGQGSVSLGYNNKVNGTMSVGLGYVAGVDSGVTNAIQLGSGTNSTSNTFNVGFRNIDNYTLLDGTTGLIPDARLSSNIARTSDITGRNIGEIVTSTIPLTDAGLHLLDGALIQGSGSYGAFVDYIAELYNDAKVYNPSAFTVVGSPTITADGIASGFSESNYLTVPVDFSRPFKIELPILTSNSWQTGGNCYPCRSNTNGLYVQISSSGYLTVNVGDTAWNKNIISRSMQLSLNTKYIISLEWTGTTYIIKVNGTQIGNVVSSTTQILNATFLLLGGYPGAAISYSFNGSIDLKQFSITVDGVEVFSGSKPANYFTTEADWQQSVTDYGVCGKFVYNSTNNTVRLPKITGFVEGTTDINALGDLVEAGLPNITGEIQTRWPAVHSTGGAFRTVNRDTQSLVETSSNHVVQGNIFDASRSNSIYGSSTTVQPQSIKVLYYIVVATSTKTDIQVDIDEIATDLNGKADVDLTNVNDTGYIKMAGAGMPSDTYVDLTLGASGATYTAPANGWVFFYKATSKACQSAISVYRNNNLVYVCAGGTDQSGTKGGVFAPLLKGDNFKLGFDHNGNLAMFRFVYAVGSESEAS